MALESENLENNNQIINSADKSNSESVNESFDKSVNKEKNDDSIAERAKTTQERLAEEIPDETPVPLSRAQKVFKIIDKFGDLFFLNIYFTFTSLPIVTIGASFTALYSVTNKMVKDKEGPTRVEYFKAFKANFKPATLVWIIDLVFAYIMYLQYYYMVTHDDQISKILLVVLGFQFITFCFAVPLQFPLVARYENTVLNYIKNSLILALTNLGIWFRMFFIWMFPVALYYLRPNYLVYTWYLWLIVLVAIWTYVCSMMLEKFYKKLENPEEEEN
ncbi:MAG: DUF624 domain-containing protein [Eubacterium sp.]|nr:DUF624 domain-containing protein [Eubacterium sp.]